MSDWFQDLHALSTAGNISAAIRILGFIFNKKKTWSNISSGILTERFGYQTS